MSEIRMGIKHREWTKVEKRELRRLYPMKLTRWIAKRYGVSVGAVYGMAHSMGLRKDLEFVRETNRKLGKRLSLHPASIAKRFKVGHVGFRYPKGRCAPGCEKGWFKKGGEPPNTLHDGAITVRVEKTGHSGKKRLMKYIRLKKNKWIYLKNYIWQKHYGRVPRGKIVAFKNPKDTMNCSIRNLYLITKAAAARRTQTTDEYIAQTLAHVKGKRGNYDRALAADIIKNHPELIRLKRAEIIFRRIIKNGKAKRK